MESNTCPNCKVHNRRAARFCKNCGLWLLANCLYRDAALPEGALFCDRCGRALNAQATNVPAPAIDERSEARPAEPAASERPSEAARIGGSTEVAQVASHLQEFIPEELLGKLQAAREKGGMVGERRIVTMLFCDVKGSTAAAERLDPEDWSEIMNGAFTHMIKPVYRYEGTVARLMGDALLAFFGAPIAHEDDPQRAVLAGLDIVSGIAPYREQIQQRYGVDFSVRVGINTGLVVVGTVGSDLRMEYSALGDAVNVAARMEQTAEPGSVQVAHDTYRLLSTLFEFQELGRIEIKGKAEPVTTYRVLGQKSEGSRVRGIEGLQAEMVGREAELQSLLQALGDLQRGIGRVAFVLGEAGLGKTRLIAEARKLGGSLPQAAVTWIEALSLSYDANQAYGVIQRLIRRMGGPASGDPPDTARQKLETLAADLEPDARPRVLHVFETLFGLESAVPNTLDAEAFKRDVLDAMRLWWRHRFAQQPTVLIFDDLHWCDAASIELLHGLMPLAAEIPLVFLCAMRGERLAPAWQIKASAEEEFGHRYMEINLKPLSEADSNELVNRLLDNPDMPEALRRGILEKAGGNPFFIEEVVRALIDKGALASEERTVDGKTLRRWKATTEAADFAIPDNLQALLAARLDRLEESTRSTLQLASVIGRSFYHRVLEAVDDAHDDLDVHLGTLMRIDLIREAARVPEIEYAFRNPLTQEAVYQTILVKRRREFHRRVALAMESIYADRLEAMSGLMAHHFALADDRGKALEYLRQAARRALGLFAYEDAAHNVRAALDLLEPGSPPETRLELLEELGNASRLLRDLEGSVNAYRDALNVWKTIPAGDLMQAVRLHARVVQVASEANFYVDMATNARLRKTAAASIEDLDRILPTLKEQPHQDVVLALATLSFEAWRGREPPDWQRAAACAQDAVSMAENLSMPVVLSRALGVLGNVLDGRSQLREHLRIALRRLELTAVPQFEDAIERIDAVCAAGMARMYVGEYEEALGGLREAEALAVRANSIGHQTAAIGLQAQIAFRLDRWDEVFALETKWREVEKRYPRQRVGPTCFNVAISASVLAMRGQLEQSRAYAQESVAFMLSGTGSRETWQRNQFY